MMNKPGNGIFNNTFLRIIFCQGRLLNYNNIKKPNQFEILNTSDGKRLIGLVDVHVDIVGHFVHDSVGVRVRLNVLLFERQVIARLLGHNRRTRAVRAIGSVGESTRRVGHYDIITVVVNVVVEICRVVAH